MTHDPSHSMTSHDTTQITNYLFVSDIRNTKYYFKKEIDHHSSTYKKMSRTRVFLSLPWSW